MPVYRDSGGTRYHQNFPGESSAGGDVVSSGTGIGPIMAPGDYYSDPERYCMTWDKEHPWQATDFRASLELYDNRKRDDALCAGMLGTEAQWAYISPNSWRVPIIYDELGAAEEAAANVIFEFRVPAYA